MGTTKGCLSSNLSKILVMRTFWIFLMAAVLVTITSESPLASANGQDKVLIRGKKEISPHSWPHKIP